MNQVHRKRIAIFAVTVLWAWTVMTLFHEMGHLFAGLLGRGQLLGLELRPWHLPDSQFVGDRFPRVTIWAGPVLGSLVPLGIACLVKRPATWFVAWFCLLANGLYLFLGLFSDGSELDTRKLIRAGTPTTVVAIIASVAATVGYWKLRRVCLGMWRAESTPETEAVSKATSHSIFAGVAWVIVNAVLAFARWPIG